MSREARKPSENNRGAQLRSGATVGAAANSLHGTLEHLRSGPVGQPPIGPIHHGSARSGVPARLGHHCGTVPTTTDAAPATRYANRVAGFLLLFGDEATSEGVPHALGR